MTRSLTLLLCALTVSLGACQSSLPATTPSGAPSAPVVSNDIRPSTKGQRLEFVEGELVIPAGTSSFVVQSEPTTVARVDWQFSNWLMPAAHAEESNSDEIDEGDAPIEEAELEKLLATVDGEPVEMEIVQVSEDAEHNKIVTYRLKNVPVSETSVVIEFSSPTGGFKLGGVVPQIREDMKRFEQRFDLESTAVVQAVQHVLKQTQGLKLTREELERLKKTQTVQNLRNQVYEHFVKPMPQPNQPNRPRPLDERLNPGEFVTADLQAYLRAVQQCSARERRNCAKPALPPSAEQPVPQPLRQEVDRRLQVRQRFFVAPADQPTPAGTRLPTLLDLQKLRGLMPEQRKAYCRDQRVYPCPDGVTIAERLR